MPLVAGADRGYGGAESVSGAGRGSRQDTRVCLPAADPSIPATIIACRRRRAGRGRVADPSTRPPGRRSFGSRLAVCL